MEVYTVGETARELGLEMHQLRYLWERGKVPRPRRTVSGARRYYTEGDVEVIRRLLEERGSQSAERP
ncbi:MAG: MerR family transcriptional regulator [Nitrospinae bacterium]|nr:MerR family transcriptional regulator [Nitrospinota bacterium]